MRKDAFILSEKVSHGSNLEGTAAHRVEGLGLWSEKES